MKLLPILLLNVATVIVAILVYDQVRGDDPAPSAPPGPSAAIQDAVDTLERRLDAIETARLPAFEAEGATARILERIEELERRFGATTPDAAVVPAEPRPGETGAAEAAPTIGGEPNPEEVEQFRKLAAASRRQERTRRIGRRIDAAAERHRIAVTDDQREKLIEAFDAFEPRRNQIWGEAKRRGAEQGESVNWGVIISETNQVIVREFTEQIAGSLSGNDAMLLAETLYASGK